MRIINKKYLLVILLVGIISTGVILAKPKKEEKLDDVILKQEINNNAFAMYIKNDDAYEKYEGTKFPEGYDLNLNKSKCVDKDGVEIENVLYTKDNKVGVKSNKSFYCYLYFDLLEEKEFEYTGNYQVFIAPKDGNYQIELWGASGGGAYYSIVAEIDSTIGYEKVGEYIKGGAGAYTKGIISLTKNERLYIYVGEMGKDYTSVTYGNRTAGGYNGGGQGGNHYQIAGGGGGATDVRLNIDESGNWDNFESLKSRIMIAGAGAGTSNWRKTVSGGYGGSLTGGPGNLNIDSVQHTLATGGTQISGGISGNIDIEHPPTNGKFGQGGDSQLAHGSGGGSGYYGGGGGSYIGGGVSTGAGGSSYISGYDGCIAIEESSTEDNIIHKSDSIHYSGKFFTNTEMIAGNAEMPTHDGKDKMVGNTGNGHAKIKLVSVG